jgi:hypothetical protein
MKQYKLDELASAMGHQVIRLPAYHCQYNHVKRVWAQVKWEVTKKNKTFKISDVRRLVNKELDKVMQAG